MANRWGQQFNYTLEKQVFNLFCQISFGASGAPTLATANASSPALKGVASIAQNGTGDYTLTLQDSWVKLLDFHAVFDETSNSGTAPLAPVVWVKSNAVTSTPGTIRFVTGGYAAGAATNPASGEILKITIVVGNSTAY